MENNKTLERLLRIQGNPKQITLETAMEERKAPAPPAPASQNQKAEPAPGNIDRRGKISSYEREIWSSLYRLYEKYAPELREAAHLDDENEKAVEIFIEAEKETRELYEQRGAIGRALAFPVFELLEQVFKEAQEQAF